MLTGKKSSISNPVGLSADIGIKSSSIVVSTLLVLRLDVGVK